MQFLPKCEVTSIPVTIWDPLPRPHFSPVPQIRLSVTSAEHSRTNIVWGGQEDQCWQHSLCLFRMRLVNKMYMFDLRSKSIRNISHEINCAESSMFHSLSSSRLSVTRTLDLFTDTAAIFKEYYGMPRGYSLSIYARFSGKNVYFSGKRRSLLHPNTTQRSFFPLQYFSRKT